MSSPQSSLPAGHSYAFGRYLFDPVRRLLWCDERVIPLTAKAFELLAILVEHRDRVLGKDELLKRVWPDTFVQENNLVKHISIVRKALGQRPDQHDYIVTIPGQGYRFVARVTELDELPSGLPTTAIETTPLPAMHAEETVTPEPAATTVPSEPVTLVAASRWWARADVAIGVIAAAMVLAVTFALWRQPSVEAVPVPVLRQVTYGPSSQFQPTWSPDGDRLAYTSDASGNLDVWAQSLDGVTSTQITTSPAQDWQPAWSPDGEWLAFRSERDGGGLYVVSVRDRMERRLAAFGFEPQWSPDGSLVLFTDSMIARAQPKFYVVDTRGGRPREVRPDLLRTFDAMSTAHAAWHPDGRRISFWGRQRQQQWAFVTAPLESGPASTSHISDEMLAELRGLGLRLGRFSWASSGRALYFQGRSFAVSNLWRVDVDPSTMAWRQGIERITRGTGADTDIALSRDGKRLAFTVESQRLRIWSFPLNALTGKLAGRGRPVTTGGAGEYDASVSRDGKTLVYRTVRQDRNEFWQRSIGDGRERLLLADNEYSRSSPRLSPDGARIVYRLSPTDGRPGLDGRGVAILALNGGREQILAGSSSTFLIPDDWSPDGSRIVGTCRTASAPRMAICLAEAQVDAQVRVLISDPAREFYCARFSPDQQWILFVARRPESPTRTLYAMPSAGGPLVPVTDGAWLDDEARWAPDGRTVYFLSNRSGFLNVWGRKFDPATGTPIGEVFPVTAFDDIRHMLAPDFDRVETAVASNQLFVPITERAGAIWLLDRLP